MVMALVLRMWKTLRDERGLETAEWIAMLAIILAIAWVVYGVGTGSGLQGALSDVEVAIQTALQGLNP